jgi:hypothetical protein
VLQHLTSPIMATKKATHMDSLLVDFLDYVLLRFHSFDAANGGIVFH